MEITLAATAHTVAQLLNIQEPQIALAGRSNVGKSSLLNALAGRKKIAKVSSMPGKTRSINYFQVSPFNFFLVDLPGYGYARASHDERRKWHDILEHYLRKNKCLAGLVLLLDCRLSPQGIDRHMVEYATANKLPLIPVLTKADKCTRQQRIKIQKDWEQILNVVPILTSAANKSGLNELWEKITEMAERKRLSQDSDVRA